MGILSWIIMGLLAGALAKWIMPGDDSSGIFMTMVLGVAGGFVGGFVGSFLGWGTVTGFDLRSLGLAVGGALILLFIYRQMKQGKSD